MEDDDLRARAIALYDRFTHVTHDRRAFMADLTRLAGSAAAANALLLGIAADPAAATIVPANDPRLHTSEVDWPSGPERTMKGYVARLTAAPTRRPAVIVIHENRGLNDHIRDVARRIALEGFTALAPDFLSPVGGTPADEDRARTMIGQLDLARSVADAVSAVRLMKAARTSTGAVGAIGFCWGGAMTNRLAIAAGTDLRAAVPYYGPAPAPEEAAKIKAAMLLHYAGNDDRVNATARPWIAALQAAHVPVEAFFYEGASHAFNNDTSAERYDRAAAELAWGRTIAFLKLRLA